jgi:hypothetical protein
LPENLDERLSSGINTEVVANVPSVSLIEWSDAIINFGSSIGMEAFLQNKPHLNPSYLHTNSTVFDETVAGYHPESNADTAGLVRALHNGDLEPAPEQLTEELYRRVIYGGNDEFDVLRQYRELIGSLS